MADVFISYKREERTRCAEIADKLTALGLNVWFDAHLESGVGFDGEIDREVRNAKCVLVLWSPAAAQSEWIRNEATIGKSRKVLSSAFVGATDLPVAFVNTQTDDLSLPGFPWDHPPWLKTLERIGKLVGRVGLSEYARLLASPDSAKLQAWAKRHADDPLAEEAWAKVEALELDAARVKIAARRDGSSARNGVSTFEGELKKQNAPKKKAPVLQLLASLLGLLLVVILPIGGNIYERRKDEQDALEAAKPPPIGQVRPAELRAAKIALDSLTSEQWADGIGTVEVVNGKISIDALRMLAAGGDTRAMTLSGIALLYRRYIGPPIGGTSSTASTAEEGMRLLREAAQSNEPKAQAFLASILAHGYLSVEPRGHILSGRSIDRTLNLVAVAGTRRNDADAVRFFSQAASGGDRWGSEGLGVMYLLGCGVARDYAEALKHLHSAAEQGSASARSRLGWMYETGRGVVADEFRAVEEYSYAANQNDRFAKISLADMQSEGRGGIAKDYSEALAQWSAAIDPEVAAALGWGASSGNQESALCDQDDQLAVRYYRASAALGNDGAQNNLGFAYLTGKGVAQNLEEARRLFGLAAQQGNAKAKNNLAKMQSR